MIRFFFVLACTLAFACSDETKSPPAPAPAPQTGTETNVAPAPCDADSECGQRRCTTLPEAGAGAPKFCQ